jgi:hypothetical protein
MGRANDRNELILQKATPPPAISIRWGGDFAFSPFDSRSFRDRFRQISHRFRCGKMLLARGQNTLQAEPQVVTFPPVVDSEKNRIEGVIDAPSFCLCARHRRSVAVRSARPRCTAAAASAASAASARG